MYCQKRLTLDVKNLRVTKRDTFQFGGLIWFKNNNFQRQRQQVVCNRAQDTSNLECYSITLRLIEPAPHTSLTQCGTAMPAMMNNGQSCGQQKQNTHWERFRVLSSKGFGINTTPLILDIGRSKQVWYITIYIFVPYNQ